MFLLQSKKKFLPKLGKNLRKINQNKIILILKNLLHGQCEQFLP